MNILITGGSQGIGYAIAEELAKQKHDLLLVARNQQRLDQAAQELKSKHQATVTTKTSDISVAKNVAALRQECEESKFIPQVLVLNAGIWTPGTVLGAKTADMEELMATNVYSMIYFAQEFIELLKKQPYARIVIIGSTAGFEGHKGYTYSVSKWAVRGVAANLRHLLAGSNVGVTLVAPGSVATPMWDEDDIQPARMLEAADVGKVVATSLSLSPQAVVEEVIVRPILGNI